LAGRTLSEAVQNHVEPLAEALSCVTRQRLSRPPSRGLKLNTLYEANLANMDPVALSGASPLTLSAGQNYEIMESAGPDPRGRSTIRPRGYFYEIATADNRQVLSFHWQPEARPERETDEFITVPHLHVGSAIAARETPVRPGSFHKIHIPTGQVALRSVLWLLIAQLGVAPLKPNWRAILTRR
jgi:hypothetical protein